MDEYFGEADSRFLQELLSCRADKTLWHFASRWVDDPRPWARTQLLAYVDDGCDRPCHRGLIKQLVRLAEKRNDDELMAHLLVAFDRYIQWGLKTYRRYDWASRSMVTTERPVRANQEPARYRRPKPYYESYKPTTGDTFSIYTRQYLQRRALRYFRRIGFSDIERFRNAVFRILPLYQNEHLPSPVQLMAAWGLVHLLYHGSDVIDRRSRGVVVAPDRTLAELEFAPMHEAAYKSDCFDQFLSLAGEARAHVVRTFALTMLRRHYATELERLDIAALRPLLRSQDPDVQTFAAQQLEHVQGLQALPIRDWLELLEMNNDEALPILVQQVEKHVSPDRLDLQQCVSLACAKPASVAALGVQWAKTKKVDSEAELETALSLREARVESAREEAVTWLLGLIRDVKLGKSTHLRELIDARYADVRAQALTALVEEERFRTDLLTLWLAMAESPYSDVRSLLLAHLNEVAGSFGKYELRHLWATALLAVHRGGRDKRRVLRQIADRLIEKPAEANAVVPLLGFALRSVREAERRPALAAVARAAFAREVVREAVVRHLPELELGA